MKNGERLDLEKFQKFVFEMDDALENFTRKAINRGLKLDYSIDSLDILEKYIDGHIPESASIEEMTRASRYLGEVFRKNIGGRWDLCLDNPKNINYKLPIINNFSELDIEFCPLAILDNYVTRKKRGLIKRAVLSNLSFGMPSS